MDLVGSDLFRLIMYILIYKKLISVQSKEKLTIGTNKMKCQISKYRAAVVNGHKCFNKEVCILGSKLLDLIAFFSATV